MGPRTGAPRSVLRSGFRPSRGTTDGRGFRTRQRSAVERVVGRAVSIRSTARPARSPLPGRWAWGAGNPGCSGASADSNNDAGGSAGGTLDASLGQQRPQDPRPVAHCPQVRHPVAPGELDARNLGNAQADELCPHDDLGFDLESRRTEVEGLQEEPANARRTRSTGRCNGRREADLPLRPAHGCPAAGPG